MMRKSAKTVWRRPARHRQNSGGGLVLWRKQERIVGHGILGGLSTHPPIKLQLLVWEYLTL